MTNKLAVLIVILTFSLHVNGQVSISAHDTPPDSSAILDVQSNNKGVLIPRLTLTQRNLISNPASGLMIYQTDGRSGFYYYNGLGWIALNNNLNPGTKIVDNDGDTKVEVESSEDNDRIEFSTAGVDAMVIDSNASAGIGTMTPHRSAKLDITSSAKGFLPPRMTRAQRNAIVNPAVGLIVYCTNCVGDNIQTFNGTAWESLQKSSTSYSFLASDIDGEAPGNFSGHAVSLSSDGLVLAIGAPSNGGTGVDAGHVRVYQRDGSTWTQMGLDIDGEAPEDESGWSVALSDDGSRVAIGAIYNDGGGDGSGHVRVYQWDGSTWAQLGDDIDGGGALDLSGASVDLSANGSVVVIGAFANSNNGSFSGTTRVYEWTGSAWIKMGSDIDGTASADFCGAAVSISADGTVVATGSYGNNDAGENAGHVRIFEWNSDSTDWIQLGDPITGASSGDNSGQAIDLAGDALVVAIGAPRNDGSGEDAGHVRVYEWNGSNWIQVGNDIEGEAAGDNFGETVALSSDGAILAAGATGNATLGPFTGHARVFRLNGSTWAKQGNDLDGEASGDRFGHSVSLSSDGVLLAVGGRQNDGIGPDAGHVRTFDLGQGISWESKIGNIPDGFADGRDSVASWQTLSGMPAGFADGVDNTDNLGNHQAEMTLDMKSRDITNAQSIEVAGFINFIPGTVTADEQIAIAHPDDENYHWLIGHQSANPSPTDDDLYFAIKYAGASEGVIAAFVQDNASGTQMNFTGQHRVLAPDLDYTSPEKVRAYVGLIVVADQNQYLGMSEGLNRGKEAITINEALPLVSLSTTVADKRVFGVISDVESDERVSESGAFVTPYTKEKGDERVFINSVGEGGIWVVDEGGALESGDFVQTSSVPGYGMLQNDDLVHNYTVAKVTMSCDFAPERIPIKRIRKEEVGGTDGGDLVNALDAYGRITWEDAVNDEGKTETQPEYRMRYLNADGTQISEAQYLKLRQEGQKVYRAAFVGCTYHCG